MSRSTSRFRYRLAGLEVESEFALPGFETGGDGPSDVRISLGEVDFDREGLESVSERWAFGPKALATYLSETDKVLVRDGDRIRVDAPEASVEALRPALLSISLTALLHQRGLSTLHACALARGDDCYAFTAPSGGGKSTLAAGLLERGFRLLTDDACAIDFPPDCPPRALPTWPRLRLKTDAATRYRSTEFFASRRDAEQDNKVIVTLNAAHAFCAEPRRLRGVYELDDGAETTTITRLSRGDAVGVLLRGARLPFLLKPMGLLDDYFAWAARLVRDVPVYRLSRPRGHELEKDVLDTLQAHLPQPALA